MNQVIDEDYETGDFTQYSWIMDPSFPWIITTNNPYEGTNCSRSALNQPDNTDSELSIDLNIHDIGGESSKESEYLTKSSRGFRSMAQAVHHAQKSGWNFVNSTIVVDDMKNNIIDKCTILTR